MERRPALPELLRPRAQRGPLIASGAVLLTLALVLEEQRLDEALPNGLHALLVGAAAALLLVLGLQGEPVTGGRPAAYQSVLLVCGLLLLALALLELANLLGADFDGGLPAGALVWTSLLLCAAALYPAIRRNSAISAMIAAVALASALLAAANWIGGADSQPAYRWLLLALAIAFALAARALRAARPRHAELMVITAGLATLAIVLAASVGALVIAFAGFGTTGLEPGFLPGFWELVVLAAGCGLIAYGAVEQVPGAAWLGFAHLFAFLVAASAGADDTLLWWPLVLLALGAGLLVAGLRPPAPPSPGYAGGAAQPARADEDEITVRVRNDEPPSRPGGVS